MIRRRVPLRRSSKPIAKGKRPRRVRKGTRAAAKRRCDALWSHIIRRSNGGRCKLQGRDHVRCGGVLQAMHIFGRGHHSVRHELWNGAPGCAGHHVWYTHNSLAWYEFWRQEWGPDAYRERYMQALRIGKPDYAAIEAELAEALKQCA